MKYEIKGGELPVVVCFMDAGETMITEKGSMSWMSPNMKMETTSNGGVGKALGRMFAGEAIFQNRYTAEGGPGMIAFASSFPGQIRPWEIAPGKEIVVQKAGFLAAQESVELSIFFQKKLGSGLFGGEGFIMQKISGHGLAFLEFDGSVIEYVLQPGQQIVVDTGYLAAMEATCNMEIRTGPVNQIIGLFGGDAVNFFGEAKLFQPLVIGTDIWKGFGYNTVVYLAAILGVDGSLYEAAAVDGCGRFKRIWHVTLPGIKTTVALLAILSLGNILNAGFDQIYNLYNPLVYSTGDIIDTWVYRAGLQNLQYSLATAVGLFKSVISLVLITVGYWLADKFTGYKLF